MSGKSNILHGGTDEEIVLRHLEANDATIDPAKKPLAPRRWKAAVKLCAALDWVAIFGDHLVITMPGRRVLGILDGELNRGRVDRSWPIPMPMSTWRRLHPRQQDAIIMVWLFGAFECHWDGANSVTGRGRDGAHHPIPALIQVWDPLDLEDQLYALGVIR